MLLSLFCPSQVMVKKAKLKAQMGLLHAVEQAVSLKDREISKFCTEGNQLKTHGKFDVL